MTSPSGREVRARELTELMCEQALTSDQLRELDALLLNDSAAQRVYLRYVHLHTELGLELGGSRRTQGTMADCAPAAITEQVDAFRSQLSSRSAASVLTRRIGWKLPAGVLALACSLLLMGFWWYGGSRERIGVITYASEDVRLRGHDHASPAIGEPVLAGPHSLEVGEIRIALDQGANVRVFGKSEFRLLDWNHVKLSLGSLEAFVPVPAGGFSVDVPGAAVVDLGTHFAVAVDEHGRSDIHTREGSVDVVPESGAASGQVAAEQAVRFDSAAERLSSIPFDATRFTATTIADVISHQGDGKVLADGRADAKEWPQRRILRVGIGGQSPARMGCAMVYFFELPPMRGGWLLDARLSFHYVGRDDSEPESPGPKLREMAVDLVSLGTRDQPVIRRNDYSDGRPENSPAVQIQSDLVTASSRPGLIRLSAAGQRALMRHLREDVYTPDGSPTGRFLALRLNPSIEMPSGDYEIRGFLFTEAEASYAGDQPPKLELRIAHPTQ